MLPCIICCINNMYVEVLMLLWIYMYTLDLQLLNTRSWTVHRFWSQRTDVSQMYLYSVDTQASVNRSTDVLRRQMSVAWAPNSFSRRGKHLLTSLQMSGDGCKWWFTRVVCNLNFWSEMSSEVWEKRCDEGRNCLERKGSLRFKPIWGGRQKSFV